MDTEALIDKELKVSLSGNLGFVSLDEVLRLLIRSGQRGAVAVRGEGIDGRVFVTRGGVSLATTADDGGLRNLLVKSELVDPATLDSGASVVGKDDNELIELLREVTVESVYRLGLKGDTFEVYEDEESRFSSPRPFELEKLLEDSKRRLDDWAEVSDVVSDLSSQVRFQRDLGEREEVQIKRDSWKVLSEVGLGASVTRIAEELGTTEFWTARVVARLVEDDLLYTEGDVEAQPEAEKGSWQEPVFEEPGAEAPQPSETPVYEEHYGAPESEPVEEPAVEDEHIEEGHDQPEPVAVGATEEPTTDEGADVDPDESWWKEPEDEAGEDVEEDTEAFLEKVFSELETPEENEEEGYGLLRRRRLGAIRDLGNES